MHNIKHSTKYIFDSILTHTWYSDIPNMYTSVNISAAAATATTMAKDAAQGTKARPHVWLIARTFPDVGQIDQIDHDLDQTDHDLDQTDHDLDQTDHDPEPNLPVRDAVRDLYGTDPIQKTMHSHTKLGSHYYKHGIWSLIGCVCAKLQCNELHDSRSA